MWYSNNRVLNTAYRRQRQMCIRDSIERIYSRNNIVFRLNYSSYSKILKIYDAERKNNLNKELFVINKILNKDIPAPIIECVDHEGKEFGLPYIVMISSGNKTLSSIKNRSVTSAIPLFIQMGYYFAMIHNINLDLEKNTDVKLNMFKPNWDDLKQDFIFSIKYLMKHNLIDITDGTWCLSVINILPKFNGSSLCHGDFNCTQCIIDNDRISAICDWEDSTITDPVYDFLTHHVFLDIFCHPILKKCFWSEYINFKPLPNNYKARYLSFRVLYLLLLIEIFHKCNNITLVKKGLILFKKYKKEFV